VLADGVDVPVVHVLVLGLDRGPCGLHERPQTLGEVLGLLLNLLLLDRGL